MICENFDLMREFCRDSGLRAGMTFSCGLWPVAWRPKVRWSEFGPEPTGDYEGVIPPDLARACEQHGFRIEDASYEAGTYAIRLLTDP